MARVYTSSFANVSVAAVQDLVSLTATANMAFEVHEVGVGQITVNSVANLRISCKRLPATVTAGSVGTSATPAKHNNGDAAAIVTSRVNDTTVATTNGTATLFRAEAYNVINGYNVLWAQEDRPTIAPSQAFVLSLDTAPAGAETMNGFATFAELF